MVLIAAATAFSQVAVAAIYVLAARALAPARFGSVAVSISVGMVACVVVDLGTNQFWIRESAAGSLTARALSARVRGKLLAAVSIAVLSAPLVIGFAPNFVPSVFVFLLYSASQTMLVPIRGARRSDLVAVLVVGERILAAIVFLCMLALNTDAGTALWLSLLVGMGGVALGAHWIAPLNVRLPRVRPVYPWRGSRYFGVSAVALGMQQLDLAILAGVSGQVAAGVYSAVNRWTQPMGLLASAFAAAGMPFAAAARNWPETWRAVRRPACLLLVGAGCCLVLAALAPLLVDLLLGAAYKNSTGVLQVMAIGTIPAIGNQALSSLLQARRRERDAAMSFLALVVVHLVLVIALGSSYGPIGAAWAYLIFQSGLAVVLGAAMIRAVVSEAANGMGWTAK